MTRIWVFSSCKGGALFSRHQGAKNWGTCFEEGYPCKHEHEGNKGLFGGYLILAKDSTENLMEPWRIAVDEKDYISGSIPADLKEKGSTLYASLIDRKVLEFILK
ncbi:hypothetical protein Q3G72_016322 [Acer saccharum]|nr:hypothetical protein Q3G72_016322 [Acer saccharum]